MTIHKSKGLEFPVVIIPYHKKSIIDQGHSEILWCSTSTFPELPAYALSTSKDMLCTEFRNDYFQFIQNKYQENLNLLYVAFTRASQRLYIFTDHDDKAELNTISGIICRSLTGGESEYGETEGTPISKSNPAPPFLEITNFPGNNNWRSRFTTPFVNESILKGLQLHNYFATTSIGSRDDQKNILKDVYKAMKEHEDLIKVFNEGWSEFNEKDLLLIDEIKRVDKIFLKDIDAIVIDLKTGEEKDKDILQVKKYCSVLEQGGYQANGFLIYINGSIKIVKV